MKKQIVMIKEKFTLWCKSKLQKINKDILKQILIELCVGIFLMIIQYYFNL